MATLQDILAAKEDMKKQDEKSDSKEQMVECPDCGCKFDASNPDVQSDSGSSDESQGDDTSKESEAPKGKGPGVAIVLQMAKGKK
jgi:hypothetical protein